jgi:glutamate/aspartate transport system permease protein
VLNHVWSWQIFGEMSPDGQGTYLDGLIAGLGWTLATALLAWALALVMGIAVGITLTTSRRWPRRLAGAYVELFRNIPLLVQMFLWYFVLPELVPAPIGHWLKSLSNAPFVTAVVALGFYASASVAVQISAAIGAVSVGQRHAALSLGLTIPQAYRHVLLPVAFRIAIPSLSNDFTSTIKNSSVALTIGLMELTAHARAMQEFTFYVFEPYAVATLGYVSVNLIVVNLMRALERRVAIPGYISSRKD